jgi:HlyD family secretion protein
MKKKLFIGAGVLIVIVIIVIMNLRFKGSSMKVKTDIVEKERIRSTVSAPGRISPKNEVNISSDIMGKLTKLYVREGGEVKRGEVIARLERTREEAAVESARSSFLSAKASYEMKKSKFDTKVELYKKSLISREEFETAETELKMAELNVEERRASLKNALESLNKTTIRSPINGVVTRLNVEEGETVVTGTMNNPGTVLMVLSDLSQMEVECEVDESDIVNLEIGQHAEISVDAFGDTIFSGHVVEVSNAGKTVYSGTQEEVTNFEVKVAFDSTDKRLRPGMSSTVDIITAEKDSALKVPIQCVVLRGKENEKEEGVFVVKDGVANFQEVETGISSDMEIEIKEGLEGKETVVSGPYSTLSKLKDGDNVEEIEEKEERREKGEKRRAKSEE